MLKNLKYIPKDIWIICIANLCIAISVTMTFAVSPFYVTDVLGFSLMAMTVMEGIAEALAQISRLASGVISDLAKKRKPILLFGLILSTISKPIFILANSISMIMLSKIIERISNGFIATPRDAYVAERSPDNIKGSCFGLMMSFKTFGCVLGPLIVSYLIKNVTQDYREILWVGVLPCLTAVVLICFYLSESSKNVILQKEKCTDLKNKQDNSISIKDMTQLPRSYWILLFVSALFMMARFSDGLLQLRFKDVGASDSLAASTIAIFNTTSVLCSLPIGWLSDIIKRKYLLYFPFVTLLLAHICCFITDGIPLMLLGIIFWGMQRSTSQILFSASIADIAPKKIIGTAMGLFYISIGLVSLLSGTIAGKLANTNLAYAFQYGSVMASIAVIALLAKDFGRSKTGSRARTSSVALQN